MNTVTLINATCERENIVRLFVKFANKYGTLWTNRLGNQSDWDMCIDDWFEDLRCYEYKTLVQAAKSALVVFKDFPPTFGQFDDLCKKFSGFPQLDEVIRLMKAREFNHPIVKMVYDKIGGWSLSNDKEQDILSKAKNAYSHCIADFTIDPEKSWALLQQHISKIKELAPPPKVPSQAERKGFKERLAEYQQKIEDSKNECKGKTYREFDVKAINPNSASFNGQIYNDYKAYLLSIPDSQTMILPVAYIFDRMKFVAKREQPEYLKDAGYVPHEQRESYESPKASDKKPTPIYKTWVRD